MIFLVKSEKVEKELTNNKELNDDKKNVNGSVFQTKREKTMSMEYCEVNINPKNFKSDLKKTQDFLIESTNSFLFSFDFINI